jgi:hypothetical protein
MYKQMTKSLAFPNEADVQTNDQIARIPQGYTTCRDVETMFPLWLRQKELLKILIEERRTRHREMANQNKTKRTSQPGDLVLVRKQVTSKAAEENRRN